MRSAIIAAAFALGVIAVPLEKKRDVVVETNYATDVVYVTEYHTVTGGAAAKPTTTVQAAAAPQQQYGGNHHHGHDNPYWWGGNPNKGHHTKKPKTTTTSPAATWAPAPTKTKTTTPPVATTPAPTQTSSPPPSSGYSGTVIDNHNIHRRNHSASDIQWDQGLANTAQKIAETCIYAHNTDMDGGGYGQNIAAGVDASGIDRVITDMFYNGEVNWYNGLYGQAQPDMTNFEHWGHFSQIVWKGTSNVGCATVDCSSAPNGLQNTGGSVPPYFTVCNYDSPGNFANEYGDNVGKPLGNPTVTA